MAALTISGALPDGVTFTDNGDGTAALAGTTTVAGTYSLTFTAGVASVQSANVLVEIGNVERLVWATQPGGATNGFPFGVSPVLRTVDAGGNLTVSGLPAIK